MENSKKLYSQKAIGIATYFGGPAAAGYLVKKNYQVLNQESNGNKALIIGIISTLLIFAGIFSIPEHIIDKIPNMLIPAIYTGIIYLIVEKLQGKWLKEHKEAGGLFHNGWKAAGIGAIFMVMLIGLIAGTAFISGDLSNQEFDANTYDIEASKFTDNETQALAVFNLFEVAEPEYLIEELEKGIALWEENKKIVNNMGSIENIPTELIHQNELLLKYCDLRIKQSKIIIKAIVEDSDKYDTEIDNIVSEINNIVEKL